MGFWSSLGKGLLNFGKGMFGFGSRGAATQGYQYGQNAMGIFNQGLEMFGKMNPFLSMFLKDSPSNKVNGIPTPEVDGTKLGQTQLDYLDKVYPGTTALERLGVGNVSGGTASSAMGAAAQKEINQQQMRNQMKLQRHQLGVLHRS